MGNLIMIKLCTCSTLQCRRYFHGIKIKVKLPEQLTKTKTKSIDPDYSYNCGLINLNLIRLNEAGTM